MNRTIASLLTGALLSAMCLAQSSAGTQTGVLASQDASASANKSGAQASSNTSGRLSQDTAVSGKNGQAQTATANQLQPGSTVQAELTKPVDARKCRPGDEVVAKTTHDVKSNGQTVLPRGSKIVGHVTDVQAREKGQQESHVGIAFERAVLKDGSQMPMAFTLQAIGSSQGNAATGVDDSGLANGAMGESTMSGGSMTNQTAAGNVSGMGTSSGSTATRGALGGVASTTGRVANTAGSSAGGTVNAGHSAGAGLGGGLTSTSQGVVGLPGLTLSPASAPASTAASATASSASAGSVISSTSGNVRLDSGTLMILKANGQ